MSGIDQARLSFDAGTLGLLNVILGLVMLGVALDLRVGDFRPLVRSPRPFLIGMLGQFLLLPAASFLLVQAIGPRPSIALGMLLVAACPGGNISNFLTHLARGNTALSIGMTAVSTAAAIVMTPLNLTLWASLDPDTRALLREVALDPVEMLITVALLLGLPLVLGLWLSHRFPALARRARTPMRIFSIGALLLFVAGALAANWQHFMAYIAAVAFAVLLQNAAALSTGYFAARAAGLPEPDRRAVSIEVGIQNSGLALILIFNFFDGLGGMAIVAGWWGVWHILSGLTVATFWSRRPPDQEPTTLDGRSSYSRPAATVLG